MIDFFFTICACKLQNKLSCDANFAFASGSRDSIYQHVYRIPWIKYCTNTTLERILLWELRNCI